MSQWEIERHKEEQERTVIKGIRSRFTELNYTNVGSETVKQYSEYMNQSGVTKKPYTKPPENPII
jgi:hypothetical protein